MEHLHSTGKNFQNKGTLKKESEKKNEEYIPVEAIRSSSSIVVTTKLAVKNTTTGGSILQTMKSEPKYVRDAIGRIKFNQKQMSRLKITWHTGIKLTAATDGGLGDDIGSSGYILVFEGEEDPILTGYSAEKTPFHTMESTREELMAMLAIEYIVNIFVRQWGVPKNIMDLTIITDKESAKIARDDKEAPKLGSKKYIRPNIELKLEIKRVEKITRGIQRITKWTKSHVSNEKLEADYESRLNNMADKLATKGRERVIKGEKMAAQHHSYPGAVVTLKMGGHAVLNSVAKTTKKWAHHRSTKIYLKEKYNWDTETFELINWNAQKMALDGLTWGQQIVVMKLIHRWLPTNDRKKKFNPTEVDLCTACGEVETQAHMFRCTESKSARTRKLAWAKLKKDLKGKVHDTVLQHMWYGLSGIFGGEKTEIGPVYDDIDSKLLQCHERQSKIGWEHLFYGRSAKEWLVVNKLLMERDKQKNLNQQEFVNYWWKLSGNSVLQYGRNKMRTNMVINSQCH